MLVFFALGAPLGLDAGEAPRSNDPQPLIELLRQRFAASPPDLVVTFGPPAAEFYLRNRDAVFPRGVPSVLAALDQRFVPKSDLRAGDALVGVRQDLPGYISNILHISYCNKLTARWAMERCSGCSSSDLASQTLQICEAITTRLAFKSEVGAMIISAEHQLYANIPAAKPPPPSPQLDLDEAMIHNFPDRIPDAGGDPGPAENAHVCPSTVGNVNTSHRS